MHLLAWYVAKVKPRNESHVQAYLQRFDVETYAPEILVAKGGSQRVEPLFPTYVFVKTDPFSAQWPLVHWTRGVSYFLGDQQEPTPCPQELLGSIQTRVEQWNGGGWQAAYHVGDRVAIQSGPFKELDAIFQGYMPGRQRCRVLVSLMGRSVAVTLAVSEIDSSSSRRRFAQPA